MTPTSPRRTDSPEGTERIAAELADRLRPGDVVLLEGDLAAGKTTFVRGLVAGLGGAADQVSSPTFVLLQTYPCAAHGIERLHHVDLYRVADRAGDLRELGLDDAFGDPAAVTAVEWPKGALAHWVSAGNRQWRVRLEELAGNHRHITITPPGE